MKIFSLAAGLLVACETRCAETLGLMPYENSCVPCDELFTRLHYLPDGSRIQNVEMQVRGEPKSGTSFMFKWACRALATACQYLQSLFGHDSCRIEEADVLGIPDRLGKTTLIFEPRRGGIGGHCDCGRVQRVTVSINTVGKHSLPVSPDCPWNHPHSVSRENQGCISAGGNPVANFNDVRRCMRESTCNINDERHQMVVLRDPRPVTVSSYYHQMIYYQVVDGTVDEYVMKMLPTISQWLAIRHILFEEMMAENSTIFWYEDAIGDPLAWHERWYESVGLRLPASFVQAASHVSSGDGVSNYRMPHPGGAEATTERSFKDEISFDLQGQMDDILRVWLPPSFLAKVGVD